MPVGSLSEKKTMEEWEPIKSFDAFSIFEDFQRWMKKKVESGESREIPVKSRYNHATVFTEEWYLHTATSAVWRFVHPDYPFKGLFRPVPEKELETGRWADEDFS